VTASMAWPNFHREMEPEVDKQVAAPAATRTPNLHRAKQKSLIESADGRVATGLVGARRKNASKTKNREATVPFLPDGMVTERSSPSRVRSAAKNAPLTAPGRSAHPPVRKEREILGKANQNLLDADRPSHGRPSHSLRIAGDRSRSRRGYTPSRHVLAPSIICQHPPTLSRMEVTLRG
jgi:hypothetical protein